MRRPRAWREYFSLRLTLVFAPALEFGITEALSAERLVPGFTIVHAEGHGHDFREALLTEVVRGRINQRALWVVTQADQVQPILALIKRHVRWGEVVWWVEPKAQARALRHEYSAMARDIETQARLDVERARTTTERCRAQQSAYAVVALASRSLHRAWELDSVHPGWVDVFGGRQSVRTLHFAAACLVVIFVLIHLFEVIVTGFWNNMRSMITGRYEVKPER